MATAAMTSLPDKPSRRSHKRATSYDVARVAGVSQSAVSRCFAPGASIAPGTRERIIKVASELGYQPSVLARGLVSGRTHLVGVLMSRSTMISHPEVLADLSQQLADRNMRPLLFTLETEGRLDGLLDQIWGHGVDGVISTLPLSKAQELLFKAQKMPLVMYDYMLAASAFGDSGAGSLDLVEHLLVSGHKSFAVIAGHDQGRDGKAAWHSALSLLRSAGFGEVPVMHGDGSYDSGRQALHQLIAAGVQPDAILCANPWMAMGAIDAARIDQNIDIPGALSVLVLEGGSPVAWTRMGVTVIRSPIRRMTGAIISMLIQSIEGV